MKKKNIRNKGAKPLFVYLPQEIHDLIGEGKKEQKMTKSAFVRKVICEGLKSEGLQVPDYLVEDKSKKLPIKEKIDYVKEVLDLCHKVFGKDYYPTKWLLKSFTGLDRYEINYIADKKFTNIRNSWEISLPYEYFRIICIRPPSTKEERRQQFLDGINTFLFFHDELYKIVEKFNPSHIEKLDDFFKENGKRIHDDFMRWYLFGASRPLPEEYKKKAILSGMTKEQRREHYKNKWGIKKIIAT